MQIDAREAEEARGQRRRSMPIAGASNYERTKTLERSVKLLVLLRAGQGEG
ncbi:MAG: hypothetical protein IPL05_20755 [Betaproteobacteria bacterium]|nr:hypothetical protein [Betaproteobacteria bacterium]